MKRPKRGLKEFTGVHEYPAYPFTAKEVLEKFQSTLQKNHKFRVTFKQIGIWSGQRENTAHYWWSQSVQPHLVALMCLFEQMSPMGRHEFFARFCRQTPSLEHPRLAHDLRNLDLLFRILGRKSGLTLIFEGTDSARTFIFTALAHAFTKLKRPARTVAGLDIHRPSNFVPARTIQYVDMPNDPIRRKGIVDRVWPQIELADSSVLLFNRVWSALPEKRKQILAWTNQRHVILADEGPLQYPELNTEMRDSVQTLVVSATGSFPEGIQLTMK